MTNTTEIASELVVKPHDVGKTADLLEMRLSKCQLGLFGYQPVKRIVKSTKQISTDLEHGIQEGLEDGRLPCITAWKIAEELGLRKMEVSSACQSLGIKISSCQLGAF